MKPSAIIIGAGIGGLSAAIRLAEKGWGVKIFEKNNSVGGKVGRWSENGFQWDTGPSVITMRSVFEDLFESAGRRLENYLDLEPVEPLTRYFFSDGSSLNLTGNLAGTLDQIRRIETRDVEGYMSFLSYAARLHRLTSPVFTFGPPPSLRSFRNIALRDLPWVGKQGLRNMQDAIGMNFASPQLRQLMGRFATYAGASPYDCSAFLSVIAHVELNEGMWYARGGVYSIAQALEKLAREMGVEIFLNTEIEEIAHRHTGEQYMAIGVKHNNGKFEGADIVLANVDVTMVYGKFLPPLRIFQSAWKKLDTLKKSSSGFILLLGIDGMHTELAHHNIIFSNDYRKEFSEIFHKKSPPEDPTIYIAITSKTDMYHAPAGCENWFVMVNVPPSNGAFNWTIQKEDYAHHILKRLAIKGFDVKNKIRAMKIITPEDLENMSAARQGAIYGVSFNEKMAPFKRPRNRCDLMKGLYFVGGTTHPGGGVPMVMLSAKVACDMILDDG